MWDWAVWGALIVAFVAGIAALALLVVRILQAWRDLKRTRRRSVRRLEQFAAKSEATAERLATAGDTVELQESLARLRDSLARLAVLRDALDEAAEDTVDRVVAFMPRK
jgi:site-specific recombinase